MRRRKKKRKTALRPLGIENAAAVWYHVRIRVRFGQTRENRRQPTSAIRGKQRANPPDKRKKDCP
jgi:hypothetical protein